MVITVKPTMIPIPGVANGVAAAEWHIMPDRDSLCGRIIDEDSEHFFIPQGGRACTECVNHLLRLVDLSKIGLRNAP